MKSTLFRGLCALAIAGGLLPASRALAQEKTAEQVFKNITALKGVPADQVLPAMQFMSASLGVECQFCHVQGKMELDEKKPKQTAREMIAMTNAINKNHFEGHREVTCNTCHHGAGHPAGIPPVTESDAPEHAGPPPAPAAAPTVTADQILEKYLTAVGGADAVKKVTTRVMTGTILAGGREMPIEIYSKAPYKRVSISKMGNGMSYTAFDGTAGWLGNTGRPARDMSAAESDASKLDASIYFAADVKTIFQQLRTARPAKIGDVQCLQLVGLRKDMPPVRLYFDPNTGLLARMTRYIETPVGQLPTQIDYADYRAVDGVKIPFQWTLSRPNGRFTIKVSDVKQNVDVDDAKFAKPSGQVN